MKQHRTQIKRRRVNPALKGLPEVKNIIAIASGKGGVGKSTIAVNLALALQAQGAQVGLLDADIYGPSQPQMLGSYDTPTLTENKKLEPLRLHGLQMMSIGNLVELDKAMIWRGPMVSKALEQIMNDTLWHDLDYLIIDLPPGTGDIQLTLSQKIPVAAAIVVTTPQDIALIDAKRAITMFQKVNIPVLGIIENMAMHICSQCGHSDPIFGEDGGKQMAEQFQIPLLGSLPLDIQIREDTDVGNPTVSKSPQSPITQSFMTIADHVEKQLAALPQDFNSKLPGIRVE